MEAADAGVSKHEVAVRVTTNKEHVHVIGTCLFLRGLVHDEDVFEDGVVLQHR